MNEAIKMFAPSGMFGASENDSVLDIVLRKISAAAGNSNDWPEKYGANFDNDIFHMHTECYCGNEDCQYCWDESEKGERTANFIHKPSGFKVWWYKYISRDTKTNMEITVDELKKIEVDCINSVKK